MAVRDLSKSFNYRVQLAANLILVDLVVVENIVA